MRDGQMKIVWTSGAPLGGDEGGFVFQGQYQEILRSVGAWLDARCYNLARISEAGDSLVIEVQTGAAGDDLNREVLRLDIEALNRLANAARNDRDRFAAIS
jgi:hypothetical protein